MMFDGWTANRSRHCERGLMEFSTKRRAAGSPGIEPELKRLRLTMVMHTSAINPSLARDRGRTAFIAGLFFALAAIALASAAHAKSARPEVTIDTGAVIGVQEPSVAVFRGIPYATPPVGSLRWKATVPAQAWKGVRDASAYGAACPQDGAHKEAWAQVGKQSEDCLFLNVWRPKAAGNYPVMVFLHGGGFTYGSAGVPLYDGANLARRGVVLVTLNYRLGRLGYFAHPALTAEDPKGLLGNYGIMDQIEALRWVKRNIARFGGDPSNVTVFGESAGAGTVQILMASPQSNGLFQKAISESGAGGTPLPSFHAAEVQGETYAKSVGLPNATADELRALPVEKTLGRALPFIDGKVVQHSPGEPFQAGTEMKIPLIIGSNSWEGSLTNNSDRLAKMVLGAKYDAFLGEYLKRPAITNAGAAIELSEDVASVQESNFIADMHAANGAPAYAYYFAQVDVDRRVKALGAEHGGELEYLFGNKPADQAWDAKDREVSKLMGDYWVRFAETGNPNGGDAPIWPRVNGQPTTYLYFGAKTEAKHSTELEERVKQLTVDTASKIWGK
jgi:para-nitrobenzyl esterase